MRIGVNLGPTADWAALLTAARTADALGYDALGLLDHYHAPNPAWRYLGGWSIYGAIAVTTSRIRLVPLVIDRLNYLPGILAREAAALALLSGGRFELGIGAGDFFEEARAWGVPVPDAPARVTGLRETVLALRRLWSGEVVRFQGQELRLLGAAGATLPPVPPRIVVGAGRSRRLIRSAVAYADEINIYADDDLIGYARDQIDASGRSVGLSTYVWDWPDDIASALARWERQGVERVFLTFWHPFDTLAAAVQMMS
ncbi:MAG TPA: LLM class flavin-dependent oxidoreductase [Thermomicrobiaceae bacterium]|nr:LLM class flavin-dependent oxidoreductase [Thermomicrobiaceae bacterium]